MRGLSTFFKKKIFQNFLSNFLLIFLKIIFLILKNYFYDFLNHNYKNVINFVNMKVISMLFAKYQNEGLSTFIFIINSIFHF